MNRKRILIVEDDRPLAESMKAILEVAEPYDVRLEQWPEDAVADAHEFRPDLVMLDILMPRMSGGDVAARFKKDPQLHSTPILFVTGAVRKEVVARHGGIIDGYPFLAKPVSSAELLASVRNCLAG